MCLPLAAGAGSVLSALAGLAGTAISIGMQSAAEKRREEGEREWANYQRFQREQESTRQDEARQMAENARQGGLQDLAPAEQETSRQAEQDRVEEYFGENLDKITNVSDNLLSGQQAGSQVFNADLGKRLADASTQARERIKALAALQSYGNLGAINNEKALQTGNAIDLANNIRSGSLTAYGAAKAVNPGVPAGNPQASGVLGKLGGNLVSGGAYGAGAGSFFGT